MDDCPDLETIAAYLDRTLPERERDRVVAHIASCETCYFVFTEAAQVHVTAVKVQDTLLDPEPAAARSEGRLLFGRWPVRRVVWSSAAAALATAAALVVIIRTGVMPWHTNTSSELEALVAAVGTDRMIEPRLSGGFSYGPIRGSVRTAAPGSEAVQPDVRIAAAQIEKQAVEHRTPRTLRALGVAYLVTGDFNRAVSVLEEATDQPVPGGDSLSDLAAAYLVRADRNGQPHDLARALAAADRATKVDPQLAEAWFNRALVLEQLSLRDEARQAWQDYIRIDARSPWADEARAHLQRLEAKPQSFGPEEQKQQIRAAVEHGDAALIERLVRDSPEATREWVQDGLLTEWAEAVVADRDDAARRTLERIRPAADALAASTGDRFMSDAVLAASRTATNPPLAESAARAHSAFRAAAKDYGEDRIRESVPGFQSALGALARTGSPYAIWSRLYLATAQYYEADLTGALTSLDEVIRSAGEHRYTRVLGLAHRLRGLIGVVRGDAGTGMEEYRKAVQCFEQSGDVQNEASLHALLAEALDFVGEPALVWTELAQALSRLDRVTDPRHRHTVLQGAALAALREGLPDTALYFQHATSRNAERWGRPLAALNAHLYEGEIHRNSGNSERALIELQAARRLLSQLSDPQLIARDEPRVRLAEGEAAVLNKPTEAVAMLSTALAGFEKSRHMWPMARVRLARARAHLAEGRDDLAEADLTAGIQLFERQRAIADEAIRTASFEQPWDLYTEMIRLQALNRRNPDQALAYAERARARTLLESISKGGPAAPLVPSDARAMLPANVTVLYYATLEDRLFIWTITAAQLKFVDAPVRHAELAHILQQYRTEMDTTAVAPRATSSLARFYDLLIRPVSADLRPGADVVVVPDGVLHGVPFAALVRPEDGRYLIEEHAVQVTPSLTMFLASPKKPARVAETSSAFIIGNPRIAGVEGFEARNLPEAEAEAQNVAALHPNSELLLGANATKQAFLERAGRFPIVHFAGHAIANDSHPELSRLLMAGPDESSRNLFARDIATQKFDRTRLVVLGACRTSTGRIRRGEGVFSLARPFLAAGVPTVVASLWDVNDRASRQLLVAFHRALARTGIASEALRRAQLELMAGPDPLLQRPAAWAGFVVIGRSTD